jgi:hypothetical protein
MPLKIENMILLTTEQIREIAEQLDCGFSCFINKRNRNRYFYMAMKMIFLNRKMTPGPMNEGKLIKILVIT